MNFFQLVMTIAAFVVITTDISAHETATKSLDLSTLSTEASPEVDFYRYVNESWMKKHPLIGEYARYGRYDQLGDLVQKQVRELVIDIAGSDLEPGTVAYKIATVYNLAIDSVRRNNDGAKPIQTMLRRIENARPEEMTDVFFELRANCISPFFNTFIMGNVMNSNEYAMYMSGGGMGLGDRDYYLLKDERNTKVRESYKKLIFKQMQNAGYTEDAARIVDNVIKTESSLAEKAWTREENRNISAMYNPRTLSQLQEMYPQIDWTVFFPACMGLDAPESIVVTQIEPIARGLELLKSGTVREIKDYYLWNVVNNAAPFLSDSFNDANFEFLKVMSGVTEQKPRWKHALEATENVLGEAIGELYVGKYFPASSKKYMLDLVENLREALGQHIDSLSWMSDATKANARAKLAAFTVKIGYPDKWKDYSSMVIDPEKSYYDNIHNAIVWHQNELYSKWGKPVDKTEWNMTPQTVNAYANALANEIVFPAAILQAPFFDPEASDAENYGGIGVVIGHEMTHGFDDQGRNFDKDGNMINWWSDEDAKAFTELTKGLGKQFDSVEVLPGLHANGTFTMGENIADQGGLRVAMTAFLNSQYKKGINVKDKIQNIQGFTPEQIFYMNYANIWAQNIRDEEIRSLTMSDVHSLAKLRVNVTLRNLEPFFSAFGIKAGDPMFLPENERIIIW